MKTKHWLGISAALNLMAAAGLIAVALRSPQPAPPRASPRVVAPVVEEHVREAEPSVRAAALEHTNASGTWIQTLRAAGVSEKLVADVAASDFEDRWQKRMRAMQKQFDHGDLDEAGLEQFYAEHEVEQENELRAALGDEGFRHWDRDRVLRDFDPAGLKLSAAESDALYELRKGLERQRRDLDIARRQGEIGEGEIEKQSEVGSAQYERQLKALLGDERYALLPNAANDPNLGELRRNLRSMNANAEQLDGMTKAERQWNEERMKLEKQLEKGEVGAVDYEQRMKAFDAARDQEYQQVLGADGFAEYQRAQDNRYRTLKRFGPGWGLSDGDIDSLYGTIRSYESSVRDYQQRAAAIEEQGQQVDWPAVRKAMQDYARQTEELLKKNLGEERFQNLKKKNVLALEQ